MELLEIKKSKFLSEAFLIENENQFKDIQKAIQKEHKKATHICFAYLLDNENFNTAKYSDDGEPSGTAGRPIFDVIRKKNLKNICVFVVRYFGGIKLGAGGLVRAYIKSANIACEKVSK